MEQQVKPYDGEGGKKEQVSRMFDNIAPYYDFLNHFLSLGIDTLWRKRAIAQLKDANARLILDVATGTGDLAIEMVKRLSPERIVGVDISEEMLAVGREKIRKKGMDGSIALQKGDSENLSFADNSFDAVTAAFGVRNFESLEKGLTEMRRVLRPGGTLVVLEFSRPGAFPFKQLFNFYFKNILPFIGRFTSKDPKAYSYLYESVQAFPDGDDFLNILEKTEYKSTKCIPLSLGICSIYIGKK
jgi:demethylmenaquinone methyltransferase/2-methoxy-6-polyprenyl-1,4-benzoquinol methylase